MHDPPDSVRVLHVDDDPDFAEMAGDFLDRERGHFEVTTATSASDGLDVLASTDVDCVVSDYDMPGTNGIEFLETVRETHPRLPFILFTGKGSEEVASDAVSAGVTDYLQKERGTGQYTILANRIENAVGRSRAERAAERSRERLESFSAAFPDVAFFIDENGRYVDVYTGNASRLAYDEAEKLVGERFHDVLPDAVADRFLDTVEATIETGEFRTVEYELEVQAGTRWFEARTAPVETTIDGNRLVVWVAHDITERKERERELERYEALTRETTDVITVLDENGTIQYQSPSVERVLGYEPAELEGEPAFEYVHPDDRGGVVDLFGEVVDREDDATERIEYRFRGADGSWTWLEAVASTQPHDRLNGYVVTSRDVSPRKELERAHEDATGQLAAVEDVVADLDDEVSTALTALDCVDGARDPLEESRRATGRATELVDDLWRVLGDPDTE